MSNPPSAPPQVCILVVVVEVVVVLDLPPPALVLVVLVSSLLSDWLFLPDLSLEEPFPLLASVPLVSVVLILVTFEHLVFHWV